MFKRSYVYAFFQHWTLNAPWTIIVDVEFCSWMVFDGIPIKRWKNKVIYAMNGGSVYAAKLTNMFPLTSNRKSKTISFIQGARYRASAEWICFHVLCVSILYPMLTFIFLLFLNSFFTFFFSSFSIQSSDFQRQQEQRTWTEGRAIGL